MDELFVVQPFVFYWKFTSLWTFAGGKNRAGIWKRVDLCGGLFAGSLSCRRCWRSEVFPDLSWLYFCSGNADLSGTFFLFGMEEAEKEWESNGACVSASGGWDDGES